MPKKAAKKSTRKAKPAKRPIRSTGSREPASALVPLLAAWPPLSEAHREAFRALASDEECARLGAKTKSEAVLKEATAWCKAIDRALRDHPFGLRRYGPPRFVWMLECVHALEDAVRTEGPAVSRSARATAHARHVLADLVVALEVVASGNAHAQRRIADAQKDIDSQPSHERLARALRALAGLADELGRSDDPRTRALVASVTLRADDAHAARAAAAALEAAPSSDDSAGTDRIEGRVLAEMRFAKRMFDRLRERNSGIPALSAGPATRAVIASA